MHTSPYIRTKDSIFKLADIHRIKFGHTGGAWVWLNQTPEPICIDAKEAEALVRLLDINDIRSEKS